MRKTFIFLIIISIIITSCSTFGKKDEKSPVVIIVQNTSYLSPNMDGNQDELVLDIKLSDDGFIKYWKLEIYNDKNEIVKLKQSHSDIQNETKKFFNQKANIEIPEKITWDGKDNLGNVVPDGEYTYQFFAMDNKKNLTAKNSAIGSVIVDNSKPSVITTIKNTVFSPNADGNKDEMIIELDLVKSNVADVTADSTGDKITVNETSIKKQTWQVDILNIQDTVIKSYVFTQKGKQIIKWDGKDSDGNKLDDGVYKIKVHSIDESGNKFEEIIENIIIKTGTTPIFLTMSDNKISPNKDGNYDTIDFNLEVNVKDGISSYQLDILDKNKSVVRTFKGEKTVPEKITWDGKKAFNQDIEDGIYTAKFMVLYESGNKPQVESGKIILDTTPPEITFMRTPDFFSPDNDGMNDELTITLGSKDLAGISYWRLDILTPKKDEVFKSFSGEGTPTDKIIWGGLDEKGHSVESAEDYPVKIYSRDIVGNIIEKEADPIQVDILVIKLPDGRLKVRVSNIEFKPNSDKMTATSKNKKILDLLGKALRKYRQYKITIEGHANRFKKGLDEKLAKKLSEQRARAIAVELTKRRIPLNRMITIGKGFEVPIVPLKDKMTKEELKARSRNRRVEFYLEKMN